MIWHWTVVIIIIIIILFFYHTNVLDLHNLPIKNISEIQFKTGDIIFMRCDYATLIEPFHYTLLNIGNFIGTGGVETHVGIVIVINNIPYVYQVEYKPTYDFITNTYRWKAPILGRLYDYIMAYTGDVLYYEASAALDLERSIMFINSNKNREFTINQLRWANTIFKLPTGASKKYKFCVQLVTDYLEYMNVITSKYDSYRMNPQDLKESIVESNFYHKPILIKNAYINYLLYGKKTTNI